MKTFLFATMALASVAGAAPGPIDPVAPKPALPAPQIRPAPSANAPSAKENPSPALPGIVDGLPIPGAYRSEPWTMIVIVPPELRPVMPGAKIPEAKQAKTPGIEVPYRLVPLSRPK